MSEPTTRDGAGSPTPKRDASKKPRKGLFSRMALFLRQVIAELRKVIWPTRKELLTYAWVVLVFVVVMAGLIALARDPELAEQVGLNAESRVLLISTEGDTAPGVYQELVGEPGESVRARQASWLQGNAR